MTNELRIGIDASNLRGGGGLTHLQQLLEAADSTIHRFRKITVWGGRQTLECLSVRSADVEAIRESQLEKGVAARLRWRQTRLGALVAKSSDLLFIPGGLSGPTMVPWVTMSQNMVPFDAREKRRYQFGKERLRVEALRWMQSRAFERADGIIFLTDYARREVCRQLRRAPERIAVIPHGIDPRFQSSEESDPVGEGKRSGRPLRLLYVSTVNAYKHQWHVAEAVWRLRGEGYSLKLDFVGKGYEPALTRLRRTIARLDLSEDWLTYHGSVPFERMHELYHSADAFVFASSCENMPNILLEAMAAGLPITCSDRGPMPEILGSGGIYFDPESPESIAQAIRNLLEDPERRRAMVSEAIARVNRYSWERCASETFAFLREVYLASQRGQR